MKIFPSTLYAVFFSYLLLLVGCNTSEPLPPVNEENIYLTISEDPNLSILKAAIDRADLMDTLSRSGPFTLFAPTNVAFSQGFESLNVGGVDDIPIEELQDLILYHILQGRNLSNSFTTGTRATLLADRVMRLEVDNGTIVINESRNVTTPDIEATNGMIHIIDGVLTPPTNTIVDVLRENNYVLFLDAISNTSLIDELDEEGPFTLFAPINQGIENYLLDVTLSLEDFMASPNLESILRYHMIPGVLPAGALEPGPVTTATGEPIYISEAPDGSFWINGDTRITATGTPADNGLIHVIDYLITAPTGNILSNLDAYPNNEFNILLAALERAGLSDSFIGSFEDNLTIFAPTDEAFQNLFTEMGISGINDIAVGTLTNILLYHTVPARVFSQDLRDNFPLETLLEGQTLTVNLPDLLIGGGSLQQDQLNIHAENGIIHVMQEVLIPN